MEQKSMPLNTKGGPRVFDKRLAREIVKAVEAGLPRKEALRIYGMSMSALGHWMSKYGSEEYRAGKRRNYRPTEKRSILRAVESGMTPREAQVAFGLKNAGVIRAWLKEIKGENSDIVGRKPTYMSKKPPREEPQSDEARALQKALAEAELKNKALNTLIDVAEETLNIDIRKKPGARQSSK